MVFKELGCIGILVRELAGWFERLVNTTKIEKSCLLVILPVEG